MRAPEAKMVELSEWGDCKHKGCDGPSEFFVHDHLGQPIYGGYLCRKHADEALRWWKNYHRAMSRNPAKKRRRRRS